MKTSGNTPEPIAWLKGEYLPHSKCVLQIYDSGIMIGASVTDQLRTYGGKLFRAKDHVRRFFESARYAYIDLGMSEDQMMEIADKLIAHNLKAWPGKDLGLILYATAGEFPGFTGAPGGPKEMKPTVCFHCFPAQLHLFKRHMTEGLHVVTPAQRHVHPNTFSSKIKNRNRLHIWIGDRQAKLADPNAIGLYLDLSGNITETGGSNFVILKNRTVISPQRTNILWGITLETVRDLCGTLKFDFAERDIQIHDVVNADEAWMPTTPYFLAPVVKINGIAIGTGKPGPVWKQFVTAFSARVGLDALAQIRDSVAPE